MATVRGPDPSPHQFDLLIDAKHEVQFVVSITLRLEGAVMNPGVTIGRTSRGVRRRLATAVAVTVTALFAVLLVPASAQPALPSAIAPSASPRSQTQLSPPRYRRTS